MTSGDAPSAATPQARRVLYISLIGMMATGFPFTIVTVAIKQIAADFGVTEALATWTVSAPMLISAVFFPLLGKLGDMFGHRRMFLVGIGLSTLFAGLCFVAWDIWSLIGFRVLTMLFAGATTPSAMAMIFHVFTDEQRTKAVGWWAIGGPASAALGLIMGGPMVDMFGWRSVFLFQIVVGVVAWVMALRGLPETDKQRSQFDHLGNAILCISLLAILFSIGTLSEPGITMAMHIATAAAGLIGLAIFLWHQTRIADPIVPPFLMQARNFSAPVLANFFLQAAYLGSLVATPIVLMDQFGFSVSMAAGLMLSRTFSLTVATPAGGYIASRWGERVGAVLGATTQTIGIAIVGAGVALQNLPLLLVGLLLQGVGHGVAQPPLNSVLATAVPPSLFGTASGVSRLVTQIGASLGLSFFGVLLSLQVDWMSLPIIFVIGACISALSLFPALFVQPFQKQAYPR